MWPFDFIIQEENAHSAHNLLVQAGELPGAMSRILRAGLAWGCFIYVKGKARSKVRSCYLGLHEREAAALFRSLIVNTPARHPGQLTPCSVPKDEREPTGKDASLLVRARKGWLETSRWSLNLSLTL